jgi:hypothetical protein
MNQYKTVLTSRCVCLYSPEAEEDYNAEADMRGAKRGDGSMQRVTPREFTPVEDTNEYLRKAKKNKVLKYL